MLGQRTMQPLILNLRPESFQRFNKFFVPSAIVVALANIILAFHDQNHVNWFSVIAGLAIIIQAVVRWHTVKSMSSTWDDWGIRGRIAPGQPVSIPWKDIASIDAGMFALDLHLTNQSTIHVDLSFATYQQHRDLKPRIVELARSKGTEVKGA
jgi:hypothetical protein